MILRLLRQRPLLIGVVHLLATPGAPRFAGDFEAVLHRAESDARAAFEGGLEALIVENFGDVPFYAKRVPPETVAALALALERVGRAFPGRALGVNVLRNDARAALGLCAATRASFARVNVHAGVAVSDQGLLQGRAAQTLRRRAALCPGAALLCDVHVKHATPLGRESAAESAQDLAWRAGADVLVVSGRATGHAPTRAQLEEVRAAVPDTPLLIGSGLDEHNAPELLPLAHGAIVGTSIKRDGRVEGPIDVERVRRLVDLARRLAAPRARTATEPSAPA